MDIRYWEKIWVNEAKKAGVVTGAVTAGLTAGNPGGDTPVSAAEGSAQGRRRGTFRSGKARSAAAAVPEEPRKHGPEAGGSPPYGPGASVSAASVLNGSVPDVPVPDGPGTSPGGEAVRGGGPLDCLKSHTSARVGLGRSGVSLVTRDLLAFRLDHAMAADAVRAPFDPLMVREALERGGVRSVLLESRARDKEEFLSRPDLGRRLTDASARLLEIEAKAFAGNPPDIMFVVCDGHSSSAAHATAAGVILKFLEGAPWVPGDLPPCCIVSRGRVAAADHAAHAFGARIVVNLIGERPGLSSPSSLGAYMTYGAYPGIPEGERNCISNIRPGGLSTDEAARRLSYLIQSALAKGLTGTGLKDDMPEGYLPFAEGSLFVE
ncbi:MAG: ethanolamine ammonia-lyase subunit EutC [Deltaproteobacteria bacterium]|jgi:ethanolamine ammonia-lyase small subunit|nr:ethanolamine ammonia-lyase subunit EutC [Deltaproteobacteria bacterium]